MKNYQFIRDDLVLSYLLLLNQEEYSGIPRKHISKVRLYLHYQTCAESGVGPKMIKTRYANLILSLDFTCRNQLQQTLPDCRFQQVCVSSNLLCLVGAAFEGDFFIGGWPRQGLLLQTGTKSTVTEGSEKRSLMFDSYSCCIKYLPKLYS